MHRDPVEAARKPDEKTRKIFRRAAIDAYYYMQQRYLTVEPEELYWPDRRCGRTKISSGYSACVRVWLSRRSDAFICCE